ncbi:MULTISPECIES: hypothetical protein, partial [Paraburkholderia]
WRTPDNRTALIAANTISAQSVSKARRGMSRKTLVDPLLPFEPSKPNGSLLGVTAMFDSTGMTVKLCLCITQTEHGEGRSTGFVACVKQNYNVVSFRVGKWLTHVICYFLHIVDRDGKHALA